jgi:hypothetical protein
MLHDRRTAVDAQMPRPNPSYRPVDAKGKALAADHAVPPNIRD